MHGARVLGGAEVLVGDTDGEIGIAALAEVRSGERVPEGILELRIVVDPRAGLAPELISGNLQAVRSSVEDGDRPSASITGTDFTFEPLPGPEGSDTQTTVKNAAFGFAPEFRVGRSSGHFDVLGIEFDAIYGETADYEFTSEPAEGAAPGRG